MTSEIKPRDLITITHMENSPILQALNQPVHVGLNIGEILGAEAESAFSKWRLYTKPGYIDMNKARTAWLKFVEIAGFTPSDVLEEVSEIELDHGFTTL